MLKKLILIGLDVSKGMVYCNGEESYIDVLKVSCEDYENSIAHAQELFEKQDWKNYVVVVHGIKSSMKSIGAFQVSEMAKNLEFAGKEERIGYILENHQNLMDAYRDLFVKISECIYPEGRPPQQELFNSDSVEELDDAELDKRLQEMERAMFDLDGQKLMELMSRLERCRYGKKDFHEIVAKAKKKVEMSDYFSAFEMIAAIRNE